MVAKARGRWAGAGAMLGALGLPAALLIAELLRLRDPVALVGLATLSAALNSAWPLGGGMLAQGTYRSRFVTAEWTHDVDRSASEAFAAGLLMGTVTALSFFAYLPILAELWLRVAPPLSATAMTWISLGLMVAVTAVRHRAEQPLYDWRRRIEAGEAIGQEELERWVRAITTLAKPSGAVGHTGGIGAATVGLHEHLDAERVLRYASAHAVAGSGPAHARALDYLASCALPAGGFPAYPGGEGRLEYTARATEALGTRLSAKQAAQHRAFAKRCRSGEDFARSPLGGADPQQARWGRALLSAPVA